VRSATIRLLTSGTGAFGLGLDPEGSDYASFANFLILMATPGYYKNDTTAIHDAASEACLWRSHSSYEACQFPKSG
jgi:hypothetical protein